MTRSCVNSFRGNGYKCIGIGSRDDIPRNVDVLVCRSASADASPSVLRSNKDIVPGDIISKHHGCRPEYNVNRVGEPGQFSETWST